ncbi:MAG TPA: glycosyltransferase family 2 protein [Methanoregulaceae archaeon]|nr:MAG: glycosyltransferase family 2 protein [Methanolinea sp.]HON82102.1 glycosyltransferase family 2 protein [Methanoregulaceae archaeon]HPD10800.1 glycosyltransferase family 2 protein [Methanoregulaceae archaeon]HRT15988.1 glycosyltransferase family 2 protein [Methanoregulaceae archaeon]HRU31453.1 glycosyltransferase family 2 protein [Methanoregulaceae archaeon]
MISIVVVNYNGDRFLGACLSSISLQTYRDFEVIVVDNGSTDGSEEKVHDFSFQTRLIKFSTNRGYPAALNAGIKAASGEYILTLNNDTIISDTFLEKMQSAIQSDPLVGMCASKMILPDGMIDSTGIVLSMSGAAWDRGMFQKDEGQFDVPGEVFGPCAGAALYRKEMLEEIGFFDEDFFMYMEDVDVAFRGRLAGWRCLYVPGAVVVHHHGGTAGRGSDLCVYYGNRNIIWYCFKDFPVKMLVAFLPWILGRNLVVIFYYAMKQQGKVAVKAKVDALRGLGKIIGKRREIIQVCPDHEIMKFIEPWSDMMAGKNVDH